jgi:hypothetical protein
MQLISGIDMPRPQVGKDYTFQAQWTQHTQDGIWQDDFRLAKKCNLDWLRYSWPWSLLEPQQDKWNWRDLDQRYEFAQNIGLELCLCVTHFSFPNWLLGPNGEHATLAPQLAERMAILTEGIMRRYKPKLVVPIVELAMECFQGSISGNWQPHFQERTDIYQEMQANLCAAFHASAKIVHEHGGRVMSCEPVSELEKLACLRPSLDVVGLDYYPHFHGEVELIEYLKAAHRIYNLPLALTEFGAPEGYVEGSGFADPNNQSTCADDTTRAKLAEKLVYILCQARDAGIQIEAAGWYPFLDNFWTMGLTGKPEGEGDRAGLIDFRRHADGTLERVPCKNLIHALQRLKEI